MASSNAPAAAHLQITGYLAGWRVEDISVTSNQIASVDPGPRVTTGHSAVLSAANRVK